MNRFLAIASMLTSSTMIQAQWVKQSIETTADFRGLAVVDAKTAWVSGSNGTVGQTVDGGKSWSVQTVPGCDKLDFRDVKVIGNRVVLMSAGPGEASQIWATSDTGKTWTKQFTLTDPKGFLDAVVFWDEMNGLAVGDPVDGHFQLVRTVDGKTWTVEKGPKSLENEGCFAASGACLIATGKNDAWLVTGGATTGRVLHSEDRGKSWASRETSEPAGEASRGLFAIYFRDEKNGVAIGGDYRKPDNTSKTASITSDSGKTWTLIDGQLPYRSSVAWTGKTWIAVGTTGTSVSENGKLWKSVDAQPLNTVRFTSDGAGWACGPKGLIVVWPK